jgi:hypothetical protein
MSVEISATLNKISRDYPQFPMKILGLYLKFFHDRFILHPY